MSTPAYKLITKRLLIRCYEPQDAYLLKNAIDESLDHFLPWLPWAENEPEEINKKIQRLRRFRADFDLDKNYVYGIFPPDESILIGTIANKKTIGKKAREIGYWINKRCINNGYATEATSAITKVAFEVDEVERVEIHCANKNKKSSAIPKKLRFKREAIIRRNDKEENGDRKKDEIWIMFKEDYIRSDLINYQVDAFDAIGDKIL